MSLKVFYQSLETVGIFLICFDVVGERCLEKILHIITKWLKKLYETLLGLLPLKIKVIMKKGLIYTYFFFGVMWRRCYSFINHFLQLRFIWLWIGVFLLCFGLIIHANHDKIAQSSMYRSIFINSQ